MNNDATYHCAMPSRAVDGNPFYAATQVERRGGATVWMYVLVNIPCLRAVRRVAAQLQLRGPARLARCCRRPHRPPAAHVLAVHHVG